MGKYVITSSLAVSAPNLKLIILAMIILPRTIITIPPTIIRFPEDVLNSNLRYSGLDK